MWLLGLICSGNGWAWRTPRLQAYLACLNGWMQKRPLLFSSYYMNSKGLQKVHHQLHLFRSWQHFLPEGSHHWHWQHDQQHHYQQGAHHGQQCWHHHQKPSAQPYPDKQFKQELPRNHNHSNPCHRPAQQQQGDHRQAPTGAAASPPASHVSHRSTKKRQSNHVDSTSTVAAGSSTSINSATTSSTSKNHTDRQWEANKNTSQNHSGCTILGTLPQLLMYCWVEKLQHFWFRTQLH